MKQRKKTGLKKFFFAVFILIIIAVFSNFLGSTVNIAQAATRLCWCTGNGFIGGEGAGPITVQDSNNPTASEIQSCTAACQKKYPNNANVQGTFQIMQSISSGQQQLNSSGTDVAKKIVWDPLVGPIGAIFKGLLVIILVFVGFLLSVAGVIFRWIVQVGNMQAIIDGPNVYAAWQQVRDIVNIAFIIVLLYSAFCTILQIESYNYKKILLKLVIMALLVNFSFPITRFIIDTSNVLMYTFISALLPNLNSPNAGLFAAISNNSITGILNQGPNADSVSLIASIVFVFILAITLLAIAILFVIRTIVLAILIIFSPIAFVGSIISLPGAGTGKWWTYLFQYSFFGPIMIFMLYIATQIMAASVTISGQLPGIAQSDSINTSLVASVSFFAVPIVILWLGMGVAQKFSIAGAGTVMSAAKKWGGKLAKAPVRAGWWGIKKTGVPGGVKQKWQDFKKTGALGSAATSKREAGVAAFLGVKGALEKDIKNRAEEYKKDHEPVDSLRTKFAAGDAAAGYRLALDGDLDDASYNGFMSGLKDPSGKDKPIKDLLDGKVKEKRIDLVINYRASKEAATLAATAGIPLQQAYEKISSEELGKLAPSKWKDQDTQKLFGYDPTTDTLATDPISRARRNASYSIFSKFTSKNQDKVLDDMTGDKSGAGVKAGIW